MKCICSQKDLKEALIAASKALPVKAQTPVLSGIYFSASNNTLEIQATDFSTGIIAKIPAEIEIEGATVVNGKNITDIISRLSGNVVIISTEEDEGLATFKSDSTKFSLYTMDVEEFPKVTAQEFIYSFQIQSEVLKNLISRSTFAVSDDDSRPVFKGCSINIEGSNITFVATNTHRLIVAKGTIENEISGENKLIVPANALNNILSIVNAAREDNEVKVDFSDKHIAFTINNIFVTCRLIDGNFPPHEKVIPASCETFASVEISDFRSAISRVEIISKQTEYNTVKLKFNGDGLELSSDSYATGKVVEHLSADVEGPEIEIAFNLRYIQDFLKIAGGSDLVRIGMNDRLSPADFRLPDEENIIYVVTPVRT